MYSLPSDILISFYRTPEDRTKLQLNLHSWKNDLSQTNCLVFVVFLMYNFHLFLAALYYLVRRGKNYLISGVFLNVICYSIKKNGNSVVVGFVLSSEVKN